MDKWICTVCDYIYDEALGIPDEGIAPGTKWEDIPEDWECPDCGVGKSDFEMVKLASSTQAYNTEKKEKLLIIGSGIAGVGLAQEIQKVDTNKYDITLLTREGAGYYSRPLLSHSYASDETFKKVLLKSFTNLENENFFIKANVNVKSIDRENKQVIVEEQKEEKSVSYDILVLATGSAAFIPPPWLKSEKDFLVLNTYEDMLRIRKIREQSNNKVHWGIIGGGLIGCEIASDLNKAGDDITLIHGTDRLIENVYKSEKSFELKKHFEGLGISVSLDSMVETIEKKSNKMLVKDKTNTYEVDNVIVAVGFRPRITLAKESGLTTNKGIVVNSILQTSDENIYAVGDVVEVDGSLYPFISPIRSQLKCLAKNLTSSNTEEWIAPELKAGAKIHGFE